MRARALAGREIRGGDGEWRMSEVNWFCSDKETN